MSVSWKEKCMSCTAHLPLTPTGENNSKSEEAPSDNNKSSETATGFKTQCGLCSSEIVKKCKNYNDRVCYAKCDTCKRFVCLECKPIPVWVERSYHVCTECFFASSSNNADIYVHAPTIKAIFAAAAAAAEQKKGAAAVDSRRIPVAELI